MDKKVRPTWNEPSETKAEDGRVLIDGPDGVEIAMTPEAANETSDRLKAAAFRAARQRSGKTPPTD